MDMTGLGGPACRMKLVPGLAVLMLGQELPVQPTFHVGEVLAGTSERRRPTSQQSREWCLICAVQHRVRGARPREVKALRASLGSEEQHLRNRLKDPRKYRVVVATVDKVVVGSVIVSWMDADERDIKRLRPKVPILYRMQVDEPHRCKGIGTDLMLYAENLLRRRGAKAVLFGVDVSNTRARSLYETLGYGVELVGLSAGGEKYDILFKQL
ncbi:GNAT family N-acetyltransferase [Actinoplanes sp. NPDC051633]|uniref:GNAT family N-acetyltransferase n=1 Tax=Actinoplanes sp. NPDC051633 TaxID=3155670 RepID=UPI00341BD5A9